MLMRSEAVLRQKPRKMSVPLLKSLCYDGTTNVKIRRE